MLNRVTNGMLTANYLRNVTGNLNNMKSLQNQLSSGNKIQKASDNPYIASRTMQLNAEMSYNTQYDENIKDTSNWLDTTDTALSQVGSIFGRVETLLVNAGNGSYGDDERTAIKDEIKENVNQLSQVLNTNFEGSYIFGGTKTDSKPTTVVNGVLEYADNTGNAIQISAYKDSSGNITSNNGGTAYAVITPTPTLSDTEKQSLINERDLSTTTDDRKQDITKILQGSTAYYKAGSLPSPLPSPLPNNMLTTEQYPNKQITLDATDVKNLQNELNNPSTSSARIDDINTMLYKNSANGTGTLSLANIKTYEQTVNSSTATAAAKDAAIQALNGASKFTNINQINSGLNVDISQGISSQYNKSAVDIMEFKDKNGKSINVSDLLNNIITDLGTNGNTSALSSTYLTDIQSVTQNLLQRRSEVGTMQNRMDSAQSNNEAANYNMTDILSKTGDVDLAEATMNYSTLQAVYTASLQTSAKVLPMTILNYL